MVATKNIALCSAGLALSLATTAAAEPVNFGLGDVVYRRELKEPLPNAFGGNDIWGRKRTVGTVELRYIGLDGRIAMFARRDTQILTNETTVNRSGMMMGNVGGTPVMIAGAGRGPTVQALAPSEIAIPVDLEGDRTLVIDGVILQVLSASANRVAVDVPSPTKR